MNASFPFDHPRHRALWLEGQFTSSFIELCHPDYPPEAFWLVEYTGGLLLAYYGERIIEVHRAFDEALATAFRMGFRPTERAAAATRACVSADQRFWAELSVEARAEAEQLAGLPPSERSLPLDGDDGNAEQTASWMAERLSEQAKRNLACAIRQQRLSTVLRRHREQIEHHQLLILDLVPLLPEKRALLEQHFPEYRGADGSLPDPLVISLRSLTDAQQCVLVANFPEEVGPSSAMCFLAALRQQSGLPELSPGKPVAARFLLRHPAALVASMLPVCPFTIGQFLAGGLLATEASRRLFFQTPSGRRLLQLAGSRLANLDTPSP